MAQVDPIPPGFHTVTPYLRCRNASEATAFYKEAFGAEELCRVPGPDGKGVMHGTIQIGDARVMLSDEFPEHGCPSPLSLGGTAVGMHLYVADADAAFSRAVAAGAMVAMPMSDMFLGGSVWEAEGPVRARVVDRKQKGGGFRGGNAEADGDGVRREGGLRREMMGTGQESLRRFVTAPSLQSPSHAQILP